MKGLYQLTEIGSVRVMDTEPVKGSNNGEGGNEVVQKSRLLSVIRIELTTVPGEKQRYQSPLPDEMVEPLKPLQSKNKNSQKRKLKKKKLILQ